MAVTMESPQAGTVSVWVDGDLVIDSQATTTMRETDAERNEIRIGENGSSDYSADIDWIVWTADGAFTPSDLQNQLPDNIGDKTGYE
jgi:peroxiredoxin